MSLPKRIEKPKAPPIKCQGIKTKLVQFIAENIKWEGKGRWVEPFMGSGTVVFNIQPERALLADTNKHIIGLYQKVQDGEIDGLKVQDFLEKMAPKLKAGGQEFYNEVRTRFNENFDSLDFLFLNRSCFNGVMRFNRHGKFNVPFGHKPDRFRQAYITKIVNQVNRISQVMKGKDWTFQVSTWDKTLSGLNKDDFVYMDPPYIGRHVDYYNNWDDDEAVNLAKIAQELPCGFALSMWLENKYRKNDHISDHWGKLEVRTFDHFYHVGSKEKLRNKMVEALVLPKDFVANSSNLNLKSEQLSIGF